MAHISLSPTVRNYRYVLGAFALISIIVLLFSSPSNNVTSFQSFENAKNQLNSLYGSDKSNAGLESDDEENQQQTPKFNNEKIGNSPQYADDSIDGKTNKNKEDSSNQVGTSPQFADDSVKDTKDKNGGKENPKTVDKDTPIKEAPKPPGSNSNGGSDRAPFKGEFDAIKDSNKAYEGVPEKSSSSNTDDDIKGLDNEEGTNQISKEIVDCSKPHKYVVMIDAGSTGSRVHVYEFDVCFSPPQLIKETFEMLKPGLSSFDTDTVGAAKSLDPLLKLALDTIPEDIRSCTPVAVKATAGLRLLGDEKSTNILKAVRNHLEKDYPFAVVEGDGISIMGGDDEGVYAWITANYLLGNIGSSEKIPTAAVFDLGGGSTQIVFEPSYTNGETLIDGEHKYEINFGNRGFTLYQFSHLGYGLMAGREKINGLIVSNALKKNDGKLTKDSNGKIVLESPCVPPGLVANDVNVKLDDGVKYTVDFKGSDVAAGAQCRFLAETILKKDTECANQPCSFNGVHQPSLVKTFHQNSDLYIFSYFYDRTNPLGMPSSFTLQELTELAKVVCNGETLWTQALSSIDGSIKELKDEPQWCLDLSFQVALLHTGYDIPLHRELRTAKKIAGNELGWCLGASLPLLDQKNWKCRVKEVV